MTARAYVRFVLQYGRWIWLLALALGLPAAQRTASLYARLDADFEQLLPRDAPSVVALAELRMRAPGLSHLAVVVDTASGGNVPAAERFIDDLARRVKQYPALWVSGVSVGTAEERTFLSDRAPLYVDLDDLERVRQRIVARRDWEVSRAQGTLLDEDAPPPPIDVTDLEEKYAQRSASTLPQGRFSSAEQATSLMLIDVGGGPASVARDRALLAKVKSDIAALGGVAAYAPGMRVGFAAEVAASVEETEALMDDLSWTSAVVLVAVGVVIVLYFRWLPALLVLVAPLMLATVYAFSIASLPAFGVRVLNANTAFLGSIIVGNGVNFGIVLLARYVEERRAGSPVEESLVVAVAGARRGTLAAALAASVSYAALAFTQFEGFRQFGVIGGLGMLTSWVCAFLLVPPLAAWVDRGRLPSTQPGRGRFSGALARLVGRAPVIVAAASLALFVLACAQVSGFGPADMETDLSKLRRRDTWTRGEAYWGARMNAVMGQYLTPVAVLTDSAAEARAVAATLRAGVPELGDTVARVRSIDDVVPTGQAAKIALVREMKLDLTPRVRAGLSAAQRDRVEAWLGRRELSVFQLDDVPRALCAGLRESGGESGRIVLVFPSLRGALWEGETLRRFIAGLRNASSSAAQKMGGRPPRVAGGLPLSSDIVSCVARDGPRVTLLAFVGVAFVVVAVFRRSRATIWVIASLVVGVTWMLAATMFMGAKVNFANFIAFPITFGIGVDYAVNVFSRASQTGDLTGALRTTGGAVALCSLTTIIGYSSLLFADNRALHLFGLFAVVGEVACLSAALVALPAAVVAASKIAASRATSTRSGS